MPESVYDAKKRVRPPRVHITYDVEVGDAQVQKEIPFVVGVLGDLSGKPREKLPRLRERKFVEVDRDNIDDVLKSAKPRVAMRVDNKLADDGTQIQVDLEFSKLDDFRPEAVANHFAPLRELIEVRSKLKDLLSRTDMNERLEDVMEALLSQKDLQGKLGSALGVEAGSSAATAGTPEGDTSGDDEGKD